MQTELEKAKGVEATKLESSVQSNVIKVGETDVSSKILVSQIEIEDITKEIPSPEKNAEKIKILTAEVENLKVMIIDPIA